MQVSRGQKWDDDEVAALLASVDECIANNLEPTKSAVGKMKVLGQNGRNRTWHSLYQKLASVAQAHGVGTAKSILKQGSSCLMLSDDFKERLESARSILREHSTARHEVEDSGSESAGQPHSGSDWAPSGHAENRKTSAVGRHSIPGTIANMRQKQATQKRHGEELKTPATKAPRLRLTLSHTKSSSASQPVVTPSSEQALSPTTLDARTPQEIRAPQRQADHVEVSTPTPSPVGQVVLLEVASCPAIVPASTPIEQASHQANVIAPTASQRLLSPGRALSSQSPMHQPIYHGSRPPANTILQPTAENDAPSDSEVDMDDEDMDDEDMDDEDTHFIAQAYAKGLENRFQKLKRQRNGLKGRLKNVRREMKAMNGQLKEMKAENQRLQSLAGKSKLDLARQIDVAELVIEAERDNHKEEIRRMGEALAGRNKVRHRTEQQYQALVGRSLFARKQEFPPLYMPDDIDRTWQNLRHKTEEALFGTPQQGINIPSLGESAIPFFSLMCGSTDVSFKYLASHLGWQVLRRTLLRFAMLYQIFGKSDLGTEEQLQDQVPEGVWQTIAKNGLKEVRMYDCVRTLEAIKSPHVMKAVLPEQAEKLSLRLQNFSQGVLRPYNFHLEDIMKVKLELFVGAEVHKLFFVPPYTPFDAHHMTPIKRNGFVQEDVLEHPQEYKVIACLWPGIVSFPDTEFQNEWIQGQDYKKALLSSREFLPETPGKFSGWHKEECVCSKAVVLVHKIQPQFPAAENAE
ncbi:hypothetical protein P154DRAFT_528748 [Amniculicola lignicola CBS 123094]|uniref:Uncharacterized protein n=1 Tax=Amniculicola lignicola CBS 123094 TaxID=1392246 RepID=A0A6A5X571_9PLEO|nr:hypothetical protein P154DRAFT_528748 [Amniculicola lignicola CBS 123094]